MKIAVVHNLVSDQDPPDAKDVLIQAKTVSRTLTELGHQVVTYACSLDLETMRSELDLEKPELIFNLVEDLGGHGRLIHLFPFLLDALGIPYTGSSAESIMLTSNKILAKNRMRQTGLPTPNWVGPFPLNQSLELLPIHKDGWIIKSLWEHASVGLEAASIVKTDSPTVLIEEMIKRCPSLGGACFAESYIHGREFNLSLLAGENGPEVLPPAEIVFKGYSDNKARIVDYQAKWEEGSHAYLHTPRRFDFPDSDTHLLERLTDLAQRCWETFNLTGYSRVDFRVDKDGLPYILEINANPCLAPDAGFAASLSRAGLNFKKALSRIVADVAQNRMDSRCEYVAHPSNL